ncbi:MAG: hypothetical protein SGCHY_000583 [Lobulomycetales sp.]
MKPSEISRINVGSSDSTLSEGLGSSSFGSLPIQKKGLWKSISQTFSSASAIENHEFRKQIKACTNSPTFQPLGKGGFSTVFKVVSIRGLPLACKVIRNRTGEKRRRFYIRCKTEFDLQKRCSGHDNILQALSLTFKDEKAYLCTEFCPLGNLESLLNGNKGRPLPMEKTRSLFLGLLNGIHYLHNKHGIAHRDIKPANLLMSHDESIKIADFGSAVYAEAQPYISSDASLVSSYWSAPELLLDITAYAQDVDEDTFFNSWDVKDILSCDVYSAALVFCVCYHGWKRTEYWSNIFPDSAFIQKKHPAIASIREDRIRNLMSDMVQFNPKRRASVRQSMDEFIKKSSGSIDAVHVVEVRVSPPSIAPRPSVATRELALASMRRISSASTNA